MHGADLKGRPLLVREDTGPRVRVVDAAAAAAAAAADAGAAPPVAALAAGAIPTLS